MNPNFHCFLEIFSDVAHTSNMSVCTQTVTILCLFIVVYNKIYLAFNLNYFIFDMRVFWEQHNL